MTGLPQTLISGFSCGDFHAGSFSASHNKRSYAHATTANKTITQTIRVISLVAPNTSPVTPLKFLCAMATMTRLVITAAITMNTPAQRSRGNRYRKRNHQCNDEAQVAFAAMHGFQETVSSCLGELIFQPKP